MTPLNATLTTNRIAHPQDEGIGTGASNQYKSLAPAIEIISSLPSHDLEKNFWNHKTVALPSQNLDPNQASGNLLARNISEVEANAPNQFDVDSNPLASPAPLLFLCPAHSTLASRSRDLCPSSSGPATANPNMETEAIRHFHKAGWQLIIDTPRNAWNENTVSNQQTLNDLHSTPLPTRHPAPTIGSGNESASPISIPEEESSFAIDLTGAAQNVASLGGLSDGHPLLNPEGNSPRDVRLTPEAASGATTPNPSSSSTPSDTENTQGSNPPAKKSHRSAPAKESSKKKHRARDERRKQYEKLKSGSRKADHIRDEKCYQTMIQEMQLGKTTSILTPDDWVRAKIHEERMAARKYYQEKKTHAPSLRSKKAYR